MKINTVRCRDGAAEAEGLAVVIDVFRASTTITTVVAQGGTVIPVERVEDAVQLKEETGYALAAERNREKLPEADYNNSPSVIAQDNWENNTLILSTSAGTKVLHAAAESADQTVIGCFLNAAHIREYIEDEQPGVVTLVAAGTNAEEDALEDDMCAAYLANMLRGEEQSFSDVATVLHESQAAQELRAMDLGQDVDFCLRKNVFDAVPRFDPSQRQITGVTVTGSQ